MKSTYKIGELAKQVGTRVETLRYYEAEGLISPVKRTDAGYRLYNDQAAAGLKFIMQAKKIGFSLKEIKHLLGLQLNKDQHTCEEIKHYTGNKMAEIDAKIHDLQEMQRAISKLYDACCGGAESAEYCTILQALADPESI